MPHLIAVLALVGCESTGGGAGSGTAGAKVAESGTKRGSAGGFSATVAKEIGAPEGSLGAAAPGADMAPATGAAPGSAGSGTAGTATAGAGTASGAQAAAGTSAEPTGAGADTGSAAGTGGADTSGAAANAAGTSAAGTSPAVASNAGTSTPSGAVASDTSTTAQGATSGTGAVVQTKVGAIAAATPPPGQSTAPSTSGNVGAAVAPSANRAPVKPPPELAAIKFDLEPNWERDVGEAGTFSLVVKLPRGDEQRVFTVRYGYEDATAPFDCDQYRKFLDENKIMAVTLNRQSGAACYIEGTEKNGVAAYRYLINYGGKRLLCRGSLYKDPSSSSLGDLRDKVLMQAKTICQTMTL